MKALVLPIVAALSIASFVRETNSHAAATRGARAFAKDDFATATREYTTARQQAPSPRATFNLGTAQLAGGERAKGAELLAEAAKDPALRADALYNRGNGALKAKEFENAIREYQDALRANPHHAQAKRNLEIALQQLSKQKEQQSSGAGEQQQKNNDKTQEPQQAPKPAPKEGEADAQSLLRSVQQQEQEELKRMKGRAIVGRVGW